MGGLLGLLEAANGGRRGSGELDPEGFRDPAAGREEAGRELPECRVREVVDQRLVDWFQRRLGIGFSERAPRIAVR